MLKQLKQFLTSYHPIVWWIIAGTMLTRLTSFMVMPFIALYMAVHTQASPGTIGFVVGCSAVTSMVMGTVGGSLADRYGRKALMTLGMIISVMTMIGFANARTIFMFLLLSVFTGLVRALFEPASQALLADVTSTEQRSNVFALRYWAINAGAAIGPLIGGYFGTVATGWTFYLSAFTSFLYLLIVVFVISNRSGTVQSKSDFSFRRTFGIMSKDKALLLFLVAGLCSNIGYAQLESNLPQHMSQTMGAIAAGKLFGVVIASNAIEVVLLQLPVTRIVKRMGLVRSMMVGQFIFALGYFAMAFCWNLWTYVAAMFVITMGEIIVFPQNSQYISELATDDMRASYFGAWTWTSLGFFIGPWAGGIVLSKTNGTVLFISAALIVAIGVPFYHWAKRTQLKRVERDISSATQVMG